MSLDWASVNCAEHDSDESGPPTVVGHDNNPLAILGVVARLEGNHGGFGGLGLLQST